MKKNKGILIVLTVLLVMSCSIGCNRNDDNNENHIDQNKLKKLPDYQKDDEINKELVKLREQRKQSYRSDAEGGEYAGTTHMKGGPDNVPQLNDKETKDIIKVAEDYVRNNLHISKDSGLEGPTDCIDNRMLNIYKDKDKGVASGYSNKNINIEEYEYKKGKYKYLIIARKNADSNWKVIYNGTSYKKK